MNEEDRKRGKEEEREKKKTPPTFPVEGALHLAIVLIRKQCNMFHHVRGYQ